MKPSPLLLVFGIFESIVTLMTLYCFLTLKIEWDMPKFTLAIIMVGIGSIVSLFCICSYVSRYRGYREKCRRVEERRVSYIMNVALLNELYEGTGRD